MFDADEDYHDKRAALLMMDFDVNEVDFALEKLGEHIVLIFYFIFF